MATEWPVVQDVDYDRWHMTILSNIYKGKGDPQDPNNHRGICLKETSYKVMSIIIAQRLLQRLNEIGATTQFGHIGCQEAQHIIKRALLLRRQHGLETFALFVDLVKAFDTIQHTLLLQVLEKYGIPPSLKAVIKKMYKNCQVEIKSGKISTKIDYTTGVYQGDNMSPVLFLFVMLTFLDTIEINAQQIEFSFFPENKNGNLQTCKADF